MSTSGAQREAPDDEMLAGSGVIYSPQGQLDVSGADGGHATSADDWRRASAVSDAPPSGLDGQQRPAREARII